MEWPGERPVYTQGALHGGEDASGLGLDVVGDDGPALAARLRHRRRARGLPDLVVTSARSAPGGMPAISSRPNGVTVPPPPAASVPLDAATPSNVTAVKGTDESVSGRNVACSSMHPDR